MSREEAAVKWDAANLGEQRAMLTDALGRDTLYLDPSDRIGFRTFSKFPCRISRNECKWANVS